MSDRSAAPGRDARLLSLLERWQTLRAQGRPTSAAELCPGEPDLASELAQLIDAEARIGRLAADPPCETVAPANENDTLAPHAGGGTEVVPATDRYQTLRKLGEGGMGAVYQARDRLLDREVALKVIRPEALTAEMRQRFLVEARAAAALDHPHIVKVFDVGEWTPPGGPPTPFLSLEFVPGGSLSGRLGGPMEPREAARLVRLLARAVAHAHGRGVVHRDLKPDNVLLAAPADEPGLNCALGCPKVSDFGLARQQGREQRLTRSGAVMGTPAYMAPEQAEGLPEVGPPADVYALGVILYRLLAGRVPFEGPSAVEVMYRVLREEPTPLRQVRPEVPEWLERLCLECMRKKPDARPSAADLAARLEWSLGPEGAPTAAHPVAPKRPTRRLVLGAGLAGLAAVGLGGAWLFWPKRQPDDQPDGKQPGGDAPAALAGELVVRVWAPERGARGLRIGIDDGAVPVREDEQLQAEVTLSEPAYALLLWIDGKGAVTPLYPWNDAKIVSDSVAVPPPAVKARDFRNPSLRSKGWPADDTLGLDTFLLLARREPWPQGKSLAELLGEVPAAPLRDPGEVVLRGWDRGRPVKVAVAEPDLKRGPKGEARTIDDQFVQLADRLAGEFELIRAVRFAHVAKRR